VFIYETKPTEFEPFQDLNTIIEQQIDRLNPSINEYYSSRKQGNFDESFKYIYFNSMNLAMKTSLKRGTVLTKETLKCLQQMHADFSS